MKVLIRKKKLDRVKKKIRGVERLADTSDANPGIAIGIVVGALVISLIGAELIRRNRKKKISREEGNKILQPKLQELNEILFKLNRINNLSSEGNFLEAKTMFKITETEFKTIPNPYFGGLENRKIIVEMETFWEKHNTEVNLQIEEIRKRIENIEMNIEAIQNAIDFLDVCTKEISLLSKKLFKLKQQIEYMTLSDQKNIEGIISNIKFQLNEINTEFNNLPNDKESFMVKYNHVDEQKTKLQKNFENLFDDYSNKISLLEKTVRERRKKNLNLILSKYIRIGLNRLAELLEFTETSQFENWLMMNPIKGISIEGEMVLFENELLETIDMKNNIDNLLQMFDNLEAKGKGKKV